MAVIAISRQVAALGDEVASAVAEKIGYKFINRQEIEKRIVELGFPAEKLKKYDERKPGFFASLVKDRDEYLHYLQTYVMLRMQEIQTLTQLKLLMYTSTELKSMLEHTLQL